jgi:glycosyltransferase involved in cell wall biosynthesis
MLERKYLGSVDGFIFNSETTRKAVQGIMEQSKPSIVGYPPTDQFGEPISEEDVIRRANTRELNILFLGNLIERKGLHVLLEAVKGLKSNVKVDIVGSLNSDPAYVKRIQEVISADHLSSFVFIHGSLEKAPLIEKLRQAHVLVVPSSYEGYGIVYLEGMGFGLPAIGTTAGAANEIITEGIDGFLFESENVDMLVSRLRDLNENRDVLIRMSLAARKRYLRQPKWVDTAGQIREFLLKQIKDLSV